LVQLFFISLDYIIIFSESCTTKGHAKGFIQLFIYEYYYINALSILLSNTDTEFYNYFFEWHKL